MSVEKDKYYKQLATDYKNRAKLKKRVAAIHLESDADINFWRKIFNRFLPGYSFDYITYTRTLDGNKATGSQTCLKYFYLGCLSKEFMICIDSDYRWLLQEPNFDIEHFVFQTYTYSFENHFCYHRNINNTIGKLGLNNNLLNFESFLQKYSNVLYELFIYHILSLHKKDNLFNTDNFNSFIGLNTCSIEEECLISELQNRVEIKLLELKPNYTQFEIEHLKNTCRDLGLTEYNAYLYFRGHNVFEQLIVKIIKEAVKQLEKTAFKEYTNEEKGMYFSGERKTVEEYLLEDIHFDRYAEIDKIKADTQKYKQLYTT
jgi:hypothetical protein